MSYGCVRVSNSAKAATKDGRIGLRVVASITTRPSVCGPPGTWTRSHRRMRGRSGRWWGGGVRAQVAAMNGNGCAAAGVPGHPGADTPGPVRAKQIVPRVGLATTAGRIGGTRSKLKRLVERGWLDDDEPGRFTPARLRTGASPNPP